MLPIIALYGFVFLVAFYGAYASYGDRARLRRAMAAALAEGRDDLELTDGQRPEVRGRLDGREVELRLGRDGAWTARARVENAPPDFTVSPLTNGRRLARWLGLVRDPALGDRRADDRFVLASEDAARTAPLFAKDGLGPRLDRLFGATVSAQRVRLEGGWVEVRFRDDLAAGADPAKRQRERERCLGVLADVAALAGLCERRRISVGEGAAAVVFGWTGGTEAVRCPYCHDALGDAGQPEVACDTCQTLHHGACFEEAGGCTVFGCPGRIASPQQRRRA